MLFSKNAFIFFCLPLLHDPEEPKFPQCFGQTLHIQWRGPRVDCLLFGFVQLHLFVGHKSLYRDWDTRL